MLRRLIRACRQIRRKRPVRAAKPRWRPTIELLESRVTPSVSSVFAAWDASVAGLAQFTPVHVANLAESQPAPQMVALTEKLAPANQAALDSLLTTPAELEAKYPPYFFVTDNATTLAPRVEIARPAVNVVKFEPVGFASPEVATTPEVPVAPEAGQRSLSTTTDSRDMSASRRAAPVLGWMLSLSCLLLLRDPQRWRPALRKAAAPQRF